MTDAAASPKKAKAPKAKKPANHPKYSEMIKAAITALKERGGSSRQAILKYISANYKVGDNAASHLKLALRAGVKNASLAQSKGTGASGSFKLGAVKKAAPKKKPAAKKPAAKKAAKKPAAKKSPKKAAKKPAAKKSPKKAAKKPAAKKAAKKPAAKKATPKKKPAAKKAAKKPAKK